METLTDAAADADTERDGHTLNDGDVLGNHDVLDDSTAKLDDDDDDEEGVTLAEVAVDGVADGVTLSVLGDGDGVTSVEALPETDCVVAAVFVVLGDSLGETLGVVDTDWGIPVSKILKSLTSKYFAVVVSTFVLISRTHITARLLALDGNATPEKVTKENDEEEPIDTAPLLVYAAFDVVTTTSAK